MTAVIIRILLRYGSGALVAKGLLSPDDGAMFATDPDIAQMLEVGAGLISGAAVEGWYWAAAKFGWAR